jgi:hypothetical protein
MSIDIYYLLGHIYNGGAGGRQSQPVRVTDHRQHLALQSGDRNELTLVLKPPNTHIHIYDHVQ